MYVKGKCDILAAQKIVKWETKDIVVHSNIVFILYSKMSTVVCQSVQRANGKMIKTNRLTQMSLTVSGQSKDRRVGLVRQVLTGHCGQLGDSHMQSGRKSQKGGK